MKYNVINYFLSEGFRNVFKNKKSTFSCLGVMCATMLIFGLFFTIGKNINNAVRELEEKQSFNVFILTTATDEEIKKLGEEINKIEGVNKITYRTQEEAYNSMRERLKDKAYAMDGMEITSFSPSYSVTLTDLNLNAQVQEQIGKLENVKNIVSNDQTITNLAAVAKWIKIVTGVILAILIIISVFIISNTIKLTVHARRKEISIMKYVGATNGFIRTPFMIEGIIIGLMAGIISILLVGGIYNLIANKIMTSPTATKIGIDILSFASMSSQVIIVYLILGIGIGMIGSSISMKKYLEV